MSGEVSGSFEIDMGFWGVFGSNAGFRTVQEGKIGTYTLLNLADSTFKEIKRDLDFDFNQERTLFSYKDGYLIPSISDGKLYVSSLDSTLKASTKGKIELPTTLGTINEIGFVKPTGASCPLCIFRSVNTIYTWDFTNQGVVKKIFVVPAASSGILSFTPLNDGFILRRKNGAFERYSVSGQ